MVSFVYVSAHAYDIRNRFASFGLADTSIGGNHTSLDEDLEKTKLWTIPRVEKMN